MIDPAVLRNCEEHARAFREAQPFRHVSIDGFLQPEFCQRLLDDFPRFEDRHALNEMGQVGGKAVRMDVREVSDAYRELDRYLQTPEFLDYVSRVTGIPDLLYDPEYIGGGTHENRDGQSLDAHVDFNYHPRTKTHRRLNLIVYLNPEWQESWGGALELHSDPWNPAADRREAILPLFNRAVIFETNEVSWHGFERITLPPERKMLSRKSFAIYLYTTQRPRGETAPSHATIYVPDALPASVAAGHTLSAADVIELQSRFARLRTQLRYLYDREKQFGAQIAELESALTEARAAMRLPLQGHATQPRAPQGLSPDGWIAPEFDACFVPTRRARGLELELWTPDRLASDQVLEIELEGRQWQHHVARGSRSHVELALDAPAGREVALRVRAAQAFVPSKSGESSDSRTLAWKLLRMTLVH